MDEVEKPTRCWCMGRKRDRQCREVADGADGLCADCRESRCYEPGGGRGPKVKIGGGGSAVNGGTWTRVITVGLGGTGGSGGSGAG
jgi:hypothetical protein